MRLFRLLLLLVCLCFGQDASKPGPGPPFSMGDEVHLTRKQRNDLLRDEHRKSAEDAKVLLARALELKEEIEKSQTGVVSAQALKEMDEIDRLVKNIRRRLMRN